MPSASTSALHREVVRRSLSILNQSIVLSLSLTVIDVRCAQGLNLWRNSSSEINDELYKGYWKGNPERKINEIIAAYDFLNSNEYNFNVSIWYNSTYKNDTGTNAMGLVRAPRSVNVNGLIGTHDEETKHFFKHSSVQVLLCPRSAGKRHSLVKQQVYGARPIRRWFEKKVVTGPDEKKLVYRVEKYGGLVNATTGEGVMMPRQ